MKNSFKCVFSSGLSRIRAKDKKPFTTALYGNGPGYIRGSRPNLRTTLTGRHDYLKVQNKLSHRPLKITCTRNFQVPTRKCLFLSGAIITLSCWEENISGVYKKPFRVFFLTHTIQFKCSTSNHMNTIKCHGEVLFLS